MLDVASMLMLVLLEEILDTDVGAEVEVLDLPVISRASLCMLFDICAFVTLT